MVEVVYKIEEEATPKKKRFLALFVACITVFALVGGGTLAYLSFKTPAKENVFTAGNIAAELIEPDWDTNQNVDGKTGSQVAEKMLPGVTADKDPQIVNTSYYNVDGTDAAKIEEKEWVALELTFQKSDGNGGWTTMSEAEITSLEIGLLMGAGGTNPSDPSGVGINVDTANWTAVTMSGYQNTAGKRVYTYKTLLDFDKTSDANVSAPLFDNVKISSSAGQDTYTSGAPTLANYMSWLNQVCNGEFQIVAKGAAIQGTGFATEAAATPELMTVLGYTTT